MAGRIFWPVLAILLAAQAAVQVGSVLGESQTNDEGAHLVAGYSYWTARDYRLNAEHPPLWKLVATAPLLLLKPAFPNAPELWARADEFALGRRFVYGNKIPAETILIASRGVIIALTMSFGLLIALWTCRYFGPAAALFAVALFSFDPTVIAHGRYVTADLPLALLFFASCVSWYGFLRGGGRWPLSRTGLLAGLAIGTKFSALLLFPVFVLIYAAVRPRPKVHLRHAATAFIALPFAVLLCLYAFDVRSVAGDPVLGARMHASANPLVEAARNTPIPAYYWFRGLQQFLREAHGGHGTYLLGNVSRRASWLYFPVAFAVKTPLATLCLLAFCGILLSVRRKLPPHWPVLVIPPAFYSLASLISTLGVGVRYLLPAYPFLFVLVAAVLFNPARRSIVAAAFVLLAFVAVESISAYPEYVAFFNVAAGGSRNGVRYLVDSNLDWGQDLPKLRDWVNRNHPEPFCLVYFGEANPAYYGLRSRPVEYVRDMVRERCVAAVSAQHLYGALDGRFRKLQSLKPVAVVGRSIYVFDLRLKGPRNGSE